MRKLQQDVSAYIQQVQHSSSAVGGILEKMRRDYRFRLRRVFLGGSARTYFRDGHLTAVFTVDIYSRRAAGVIVLNSLFSIVAYRKGCSPVP